MKELRQCRQSRSSRPIGIRTHQGLIAVCVSAILGFHGHRTHGQELQLSEPTEQNAVVRIASLPPALQAAASLGMIFADETADAQPTTEVVEQTEKEKDSLRAEQLRRDEERRKRLRDLLKGDQEDREGDSDSMNERFKRIEAELAPEPDSGDFDQGSSNQFDRSFISNELPEINQGRFQLPPLRAVSIDERQIGNGQIPEAVSAGDELSYVSLPEDGNARLSLTGPTPSGAWPSLMRPWAAPNTFSHPLYFEDRMLERHGHERWGCLQPIAAGARFFTSVAMLPYLSAIDNPCEFKYSNGYYRAGSSVPRFYQRPPLERRAVVTQAAATAGAFIALP